LDVQVASNTLIEILNTTDLSVPQVTIVEVDVVVQLTQDLQGYFDELECQVKEFVQELDYHSIRRGGCPMMQLA
jgi:hypothetical protein